MEGFGSLGFLSLEAPRSPLWQSERSGVFLFLESQPLINFLANLSLQLMIRNEFGPITACHGVGFVFLLVMMSEMLSTKHWGEGTIGITGGIGEEDEYYSVGKLGIFYIILKCVDWGNGCV